MRHIKSPENNPNAAQNDVYKDGALPLEYALAYRTAANASNPQRLTLLAQNEQELSRLLQLLPMLNAQKDGEALSPQSLQTPAFKSLLRAGYADAQGKVTPRFKGRPPSLEIIYAKGSGHAAVIAMNDRGAAYLDSKGAAAPQNLASDQSSLKSAWLKLYHGQKHPQERQKLANSDAIHLHQGIKQQTQDDDSVDWCIANLEKLSANVSTTHNMLLQQVKKAPRKQLVKAINGKLDPRDPNGQKRFTLQYRSQKKHAHQWRQMKQQLVMTEKAHKEDHTKAHTLWEKALKQGKQCEQWAKVFIEDPPEYHPDEKYFNKYETTREGGVKNTLELKPDSIVATSTGGEVTYAKRFENLAADLQQALADAKRHVKLPVVIKSVEPPEKEQACRAAFEKVFGKGKNRVDIRKAPKKPKPPIQPRAITGHRPGGAPT